MNAYEAIMKAADSIEQNPGLFDFGSVVKPDYECGTPGCALGWIQFHAGIRGLWWMDAGFYRLLGARDDAAFYEKMNGVYGSGLWTGDATKCAAALRLYAEKFHGDEKPKHKGIPAETLAIFETA